MRLFAILFTAVFWISCSSEKEEVFIPEDKMANIYADIRVIDAANYHYTHYDTLPENFTDDLMSSTFAKYEVTQEEFMKSHEHYLTDVHALQRIYEKVEIMLQERKARVETHSEGVE
jgi:hypothetical protein